MDPYLLPHKPSSFDALGCIFCGSTKDPGLALTILGFWLGLVVYSAYRAFSQLWRRLSGASLRAGGAEQTTAEPLDLHAHDRSTKGP